MVSGKHLFIFSLLVAVLFSLGSGVSYGQSHVWNGSVSSDWDNPANWDAGTVPGPGSSVKITNMANKPVLSGTATVASLQLASYYPGAGLTYLTVASGGDLTVTNSITFISQGSLHIDGGSVTHTGTNFDMGYNADQYIEITSGSFSTNADVDLNGGNTTQPALSLGSGSATFNGSLQVSSDKRVDVENGTLEVFGATTINGTYNADDGTSTFNSTVSIGSGGVLDLDSGTLNFNDYTSISNNGTAYLGTGTANFASDVDVQSGGFLYVESGEMNVTGDANFSNNGNLYVDDGSVNVTGNASLSSGGEMEFTSGSFNVGGNSSFTNGGNVSLGDSEVEMQGDLTVEGGSNFDSGTSTVTFSGDGNQSINTGGNDIVFHDVVVKSGSSVQTDGDTENTVTIENSLTVEDGGTVVVKDDDTIDVVGELEDENEDGGGVSSPRPFVKKINTPTLNEVVVTFNKAMDATTTEVTGNYSINNSINVNNATQDPLDDTKVTLSVSTLTEGVEYELTINNLESTDGGVISTNHLKKFTTITQVTFYSRQNGSWNTNTTWSTTSHTGSAATSNPTTENDAIIIIGNGHTVSVNSSATITDQQSVTVNTSSVLEVASGGVLTLGTDAITGSGTFQLSDGTVEIGSADGITSSGNTGNIQTDTRNFGTNGSYVYNGSTAQVTGSGLPSQVNNLTIDNSAGVTATKNIETTGTLFLTEGSLLIQSGKNLVSNTKNIGNGDLIMEHTITGSTGWRLLSSPLSSTYGDLLDQTVTQGYPGAYYSSDSSPGDELQPNVMYYDETYHTNTDGLPATDNQRWRAPTSASTAMPAEQGIYTFFFGDIDADPLYNDLFPLPTTLQVQGQENEGDGTEVDFNVTYTASADSGWNLVGNPFAATIDWDDAASWTKTNIDNTIYAWDPATSSFKTWNGTAGDLDSQGLIAPFQGFWVKANDENPVLKVEKSAKTFGGTYVGKQREDKPEHPVISMRISDGQKEASTHFMFSEDASLGKDPNDAYRLVPPPRIHSFLEISSQSPDGEVFAINNLPRRFGKPIEIPIYLEAYENGYATSKELELTLDKLQNIPGGWTIDLIDNERKSKISLTSGFRYTFSNSGGANKIAPNNDQSGKPKIASKTKKNSPRFTLVIAPGEDAAELPQSFKLSQNYPNPFNPTTKIEVNLPLQSYVELAVYNMLGQKVQTLVRNELSAGTHTFEWDASSQSSGIYLYRLVTNEATVTKKMTLIK